MSNLLLRDNLMRILFVFSLVMCIFVCKGQIRCDDLPSKHPPYGFRHDTCILAELDVSYYMNRFIQRKDSLFLGRADSLINVYCSICEQNQKTFLYHKFKISMFRKQYEEGINFFTDHPVNGFESLWNRDFYLTTMQSAKYLADKDSISYDSINTALLRIVEDNIKIKDAASRNKALPVHMIVKNNFPELFIECQDLICIYYTLRVRIEGADSVLEELYYCKENYPDQFSFEYYSLLNLIETIKYMNQTQFHFEYEY